MEHRRGERAKNAALSLLAGGAIKATAHQREESEPTWDKSDDPPFKARPVPCTKVDALHRVEPKQLVELLKQIKTVPNILAMLESFAPRGTSFANLMGAADACLPVLHAGVCAAFGVVLEGVPRRGDNYIKCALFDVSAARSPSQAYLV